MNTPVEKHPPETAEEDPGKAFEHASRINELVDKRLITADEIANASPRQMDQLAARTMDLVVGSRSEGSNIRAKVETVLGKGSGEKVVRNRLKARACLLATYMALKHPKEFAGIAFFGSRTNPEALPKTDSDLDALIILKPGVDGFNVSIEFSLDISEFNIAHKIMGTHLDGHLVTNEQIMTLDEKDAARFYPEVSADSIVIITDKTTRRHFRGVFGDQMSHPQDFSKKGIIGTAKY